MVPITDKYQLNICFKNWKIFKNQIHDFSWENYVLLSHKDFNANPVIK